MNKINLRVFKRDEDSVALFWDTDKLPLKEYRSKITVIITKLNGTVFEADAILQSGSEKDLSAECMIIEYKNNSLRYDEQFDISMLVDKGSEKPLEIVKYTVYKSGVHPDFERDDKVKNIHLMAWDPKKNTWRKVCGVDTNEGFALLIKNI